MPLGPNPCPDTLQSLQSITFKGFASTKDVRELCAVAGALPHLTTLTLVAAGSQGHRLAEAALPAHDAFGTLRALRNLNIDCQVCWEGRVGGSCSVMVVVMAVCLCPWVGRENERALDSSPQQLHGPDPRTLKSQLYHSFHILPRAAGGT